MQTMLQREEESRRENSEEGDAQGYAYCIDAVRSKIR